jgi:hypothetical protein
MHLLPKAVKKKLPTAGSLDLSIGACLGFGQICAVHARVARVTEGNQILARIITGVAAKLFVVNLKVGHCAARLASPTVAA